MANEANRPIWNAVDYATRTGRLVPQPCEVCGVAKTDAHHDDYTRPLDVRWLCRSHHSQQHGQRGRKRSAACQRGHEWTEENTYLYRGVRQCRTCRRAAVDRYSERMR